MVDDGRSIVTAGSMGCDGPIRISVRDRSTGDRRWSVEVAGGFGRRQLSLAGGAVVHAGGDGVVARELADGAVRWSLDVGDEAEVLVGGRGDDLVAGVYEWATAPRSSRLVFIDPADGSERWETSLDGRGQLVDVAVLDDLAVVRMSGDGPDDAARTRVVAVGLDDGAIRWERDLGISEIAEPLLPSEDHVVVGLRTIAFSTAAGDDLDVLPPSSSVVVLDTATGAERWRIDRQFALDDVEPRDVQAFDTDESVVLARVAERVVALDATTGLERWSTPGLAGAGWLVDALAVVVPQQRTDVSAGDLDALDVSSGELRWSRATEGVAARAAGGADLLVIDGYGRTPSCD